MKSSVNSKKIRKQSDKIAVLAVIFVWLIVGFLGFFQKFDLRLYDFFLGIRKPPLKISLYNVILSNNLANVKKKTFFR